METGEAVAVAVLGVVKPVLLSFILKSSSHHSRNYKYKHCI